MATIELPKDAKGREIPLDTECLYTCNGEKQDVLSFTYYRRRNIWEIETDTYIVNSIYLYITPPDSWEKLLEDLDEAASNMCCASCTYFGEDDADCDTCTIGDISSCDSAAMSDVASRIRRLRGED